MKIEKSKTRQTHEAIIFFDDGKINKQMLFTEFEALLDCVVPVRSFSAKTLDAAYLRLDGRLHITAAVFFLIAFDEDGYPEASWNIPLGPLADKGAKGPDLGGGQVRIASRSQCPLEGYEDQLWNPRYGKGANTLNLLQESMKENPLGIDADEEPEPDQSAATMNFAAMTNVGLPGQVGANDAVMAAKLIVAAD